MSPVADRTDLPVLVLHDWDETRWPAPIRDDIRDDILDLGAALEAHGHPVTRVTLYDTDLQACLNSFSPGETIVFNMCEGVPGVPRSDGRVAEALEDMGFTYTGSAARALDLSWDKAQTKHLMDAHGVPTPRWHIYATARTDGWLRFPAIVKPAWEHCSRGVTPEAVVLTAKMLQDRIAYVLDEFHQPALVEEFVDGREFHVSVWGNRSLEMLPPIEMDFGAFDDVRDRLCTFDSKFVPGSTHYTQIRSHIPARLQESESRQLERVAWAAYRLLDCRDYARMDIRRRGGALYVLDINPNADVSREASLACSANVAGYSYGAMASHLVNLAAQRHPVFGRPARFSPNPLSQEVVP